MTTPNTEQRNDAVREALIERLGTFADLLSADPLEGERGDVAYDLLRQAAAQISSDRLRIAALSQPPAPSPLEGEVREKVARAICKARGETPDQCLHGYSWAAGEMGRAEGGEVCHRRAWQYHIAAADAAIAALSTEAGSVEVPATGQYDQQEVTAEIDWLAGLAKKSVDTRSECDGINKAVDMIRAAIAEAGKPAPAEPVAVRKIETVTGDFMQEPGEPFWRIELDGYCADFDHEQAAINFAAAINRRPAPVEPAPSEERLREAFKAGWRTNAVGEETHPASYLDGCEQTDWEEYQSKGLNAYIAALSGSAVEDKPLNMGASLRDRAFVPSGSSQPAAVSPVPASIPSAAHTPGPWYAVPYGDGDSPVICSDQYGEWRICFMATPGDMFSIGRMEEIKANARLIATAPELLHALQCVVSSHDGGSYESDGMAIDHARAIIAKAQGMSAGTAETAQQAQGEARQPGPKDASKTSRTGGENG